MGKESYIRHKDFCTSYFCLSLCDQSCYQIEISPEFGSFSGAFLGTFDKNEKVLWYF